MIALLPIHIIAASLALVCGVFALSAPKGGRLHRRSGTIYVYAMLAMSASGTALALAKGDDLNILTGGLVFYLVVTGWLTALPTVRARRSIALGTLLTASTLAVASAWSGLRALVHGHPFAGVLFVFGALAALSAWGDLRVLNRGIVGAQRLARHLWRMGLSLLISLLALPRVLPEGLRKSSLLAIPVGFVLVVVVYWFARMTFVKSAPRR